MRGGPRHSCRFSVGLEPGLNPDGGFELSHPPWRPKGRGPTGRLKPAATADCGGLR